MTRIISNLTIFLLLAICATIQGSVIKKKINGVWYSFDTSAKTVAYVAGQGSETNRSEFTGSSLHVPATMVYENVTYKMTDIHNCFEGCTSLKELTFDSPASFKQIDLWAFAKTSIKKVEIPEGVTTLGADRAFGYISTLEEAVVPSTIKAIGGWSFSDDPNLKIVIIKAINPPTLGTEAFGGGTKCTIVVPDDALSKYKSNANWKSFTIISESEYKNPSPKSVLSKYLTDNADLMKSIKGGNTSDTYRMEEYQLFADAKLNADTLLQGEYEKELYAEALERIKKTLEDVQKTYNPIVSGYYQIVSSYSKFQQVQHEAKAMTADNGTQLGWKKYDDLDPYEVFYVEAFDDGKFTLKSFANGNYINGSRADMNKMKITMGAESQMRQEIKPIGYLEWLINDEGHKKTYNADGSSNGNGINGNVVLYNANDKDGASTWKFIPVDKSLIEVMTILLDGKKNTTQLKNLYTKASELCNSTLSYTYDTKGLVKKASQFSSNAKSSKEGTYESLIDNHTGSPFFHSTYDAEEDPGKPHYIQVDLTSTPIKGFRFKISRRDGAYGLMDAPTIINIYVSKDGKSFVLFDVYKTTWNEASIELKTSELIHLGDEYNYVRFEVTETMNNRNTGRDYPYFTASELQLYKAIINEENSLYYSTEGIKEAIQELKKLQYQQQERIDLELVEESDIEIFEQTMERLQSAIDNPIPLKVRKTFYNQSNNGDVYGINAIKNISRKIPGIYIKGKKKILE
ncbi:MAG: leucine-rich repeat domain-containing protein [Prevotellaceae bacterium]|nr:leucine-rich repeat domain-containing protein [Candidatus Faecinaster equi]